VSRRLELSRSGRVIDPKGCSGLSSPGDATIEAGGASGLAGASMDPASVLAFRLRAMTAGEGDGPLGRMELVLGANGSSPGIQTSFSSLSG
jgi:hypothetical protein